MKSLIPGIKKEATLSECVDYSSIVYYLSIGGNALSKKEAILCTLCTLGGYE